MPDYPTEMVLATDLNDTHVLVGECEGLSAIFETSESSLIRGLVRVETEHGSLYLDPEMTYKVLKEE